jgi:type IV secretion system protein VirB10
VSQNTPHDPVGHPQAADANPYYANRPDSVAPDLDANAPQLRSADIQRLNRKALLFLAGIVVLLILAAIWLFGSALSDREKAAPARTEQLVIPDAPKDAPLPDLPPESQPAPPEPSLPPLPLADAADTQPAPSFSMPEGATLPFKEPSLLERRISGGADGTNAAEGSGAAGVPGMMSPDAYAQMLGAVGNEGQRPPQAQAQVEEKIASAQPIYNPDTLLVRGTYLRCVLETRVITDVSGFTSCVVTEPVYSINGRRLLLPKGSKISGTYGNDAISGNRVAVVWDRITTPNGLDVNMRSPGVDSLGGAGHPGHYNAHWPERISSALLISLLSDAFKYAGAKNGPQETSIVNGTVIQSPYESNTARTMERLANLALDKSMSRPATVTINQGTIVNVYVARDVDFSTVLR